MSGNNLQVVNTGLDHCYINGIPIVEAEISISDIYKKVARISSLAVQADPYFNSHTNAQKLFSESHGEGDRITKDFLEEGARELLSMFIPFQRLIPEGNYDSSSVEYSFTDQTSDFEWDNPDSASIFLNSILVTATSGQGDITFVADGVELGTITIPESDDGSGDLAYDLAGFLGGALETYYNYSHSENMRNSNMAGTIDLLVTNNTADFVFDIKIFGIKYDALKWIKALTSADDVKLPAYTDDINVNYLCKEFSWINRNRVNVKGAIIKHNGGSAYVTISYNGISATERYIEGDIIGEDFNSLTGDITNVSVTIRDASNDFNYNLVINTELPKIIPSPRFEFDSNWNEGKIIYRYQNMDTRNDKLNYTSETLKDIRIDPNTFDEVLKYLKDSLKNYVLKELYLAVGYDRKAVYYESKYVNSRSDAKFWLRSEKGLQTQNNHVGV